LRALSGALLAGLVLLVTGCGTGGVAEGGNASSGKKLFLTEGKCGGCHLKVSSEVESAARGKTIDPTAALPTCDQCGRIVYWEA